MSESSDRPVRYFGENARGWLWLNWPRLVLTAVLVFYFWLMVVPRDLLAETPLPGMTPG